MTDHASTLRAIVVAHGLRYRDVAELALVSVKCVEGWLASPGTASSRPVRERDVLLITHRLPEWLSGRSQAAAVECNKAKTAANGEA